MQWSQCRNRYCHVCYCRQWEPPSLALCLKKTHPKNPLQFLQCTQENVWHLLLLLSSILAVFHYLSNGTLVLCQEKYSFPILIMLPDYPLVYILPGLLSIYATIWNILKWLWWNLSLTVLARAGICSRVDACSSLGGRSALHLSFLTASIYMRKRHHEGSVGSLGQGSDLRVRLSRYELLVKWQIKGRKRAVCR